MATGWVKIHRELMDSFDYSSQTFCKNMAWIDLIMLANYAPGFITKRGILVSLNRGDVGRSQDELAKRWRWSRGKVIRYLLELETKGWIVQQGNNITTCITIVDYSKYQDDSTANDHPGVKKPISEQYLNKKNKEIKKKEDMGANAPLLELKNEIDIKFGQFKEWLLKNAPAILKMQQPVTVDQYFKLQEEFNTPGLKKLLFEKFKAMANRTDLKKNKSAYETVINWARKDIERDPEKFKLSVASINPVISNGEKELLGTIEQAKQHGFTE